MDRTAPCRPRWWVIYRHAWSLLSISAVCLQSLQFQSCIVISITCWLTLWKCQSFWMFSQCSVPSCFHPCQCSSMLLQHPLYSALESYMHIGVAFNGHLSLYSDVPTSVVWKTGRVFYAESGLEQSKASPAVKATGASQLGLARAKLVPQAESSHPRPKRSTVKLREWQTRIA